MENEDQDTLSNSMSSHQDSTPSNESSSDDVEIVYPLSSSGEESVDESGGTFVPATTSPPAQEMSIDGGAVVAESQMTAIFQNDSTIVSLVPSPSSPTSTNATFDEQLQHSLAATDADSIEEIFQIQIEVIDQKMADSLAPHSESKSSAVVFQATETASTTVVTQRHQTAVESVRHMKRVELVEIAQESNFSDSQSISSRVVGAFPPSGDEIDVEQRCFDYERQLLDAQTQLSRLHSVEQNHTQALALNENLRHQLQMLSAELESKASDMQLSKRRIEELDMTQRSGVGVLLDQTQQMDRVKSLLNFCTRPHPFPLFLNPLDSFTHSLLFTPLTRF